MTVISVVILLVSGTRRQFVSSERRSTRDMHVSGARALRLRRF